MTNTPLVLGVVFLGISGLCLVLFVVTIARRWAMERRGAWATGVIVERTRDSSPSITVRFRDLSGVEHDARSVGGSTGFPEVGEASRVLFETARPQRHVLEEDMRLQRWLFPALILIFGGVGAAMLGVGLRVVGG